MLQTISDNVSEGVEDIMRDADTDDRDDTDGLLPLRENQGIRPIFENNLWYSCSSGVLKSGYATTQRKLSRKIKECD